MSSTPGRPAELPIRYDKVVFNGSGQSVPPWGVVQVSAAPLANTEEIYTITKPNGAAKAKYFLNGPQAIVAGGYGSCTDSYPAVSLVAYTGSPPGISQEWGPVSGSWAITINGKGFLILGGLSGDTVRVASIPPAATSGADFPLIRIRNASGVTRPIRSIVGIGAPIGTPPAEFVTQPTFNSAVPGELQPFCVLMAEVAPNDIVDAAPLGIVSCQMNFTDQAHTRAKPITGDYAKVTSSHQGQARILWREKQGVSGSGTLGIQWAFLFLGSGVSPFLKHGRIVNTLSPATPQTNSGINEVVPGSGLVRIFVPRHGTPRYWPADQSGLPANEVWMHWLVDEGKENKPVMGLTDEHGVTWAITGGCSAMNFPSG